MIRKVNCIRLVVEIIYNIFFLIDLVELIFFYLFARFQKNLQDALRQERQFKDRLGREKDVLIAEKFNLEQQLAVSFT